MNQNLLLAGTAGGNSEIKNPVLGDGLQSLFQGSDPAAFLGTFIPKFIGLILVFGALAFFFMLLFGAITYIISGGDKAKVESAKSRLSSAFVGFILLIATFAIVKLIETFFGINILSIDIGTLVIQ